jgi:hypothetical protein
MYIFDILAFPPVFNTISTGGIDAAGCKEPIKIPFSLCNY